MKRIFRRNQIILTLLAVMIAVAGYLNYAGKEMDTPVSENGDVTDAPVGNGDISEEDILAENMAVLQQGGSQPEEKPENDPAAPGEAILVGGTAVVDYLAQVRLSREQVRAKSKENYLEVINNAALSEEAKAQAVGALLELTETAEKENAAETLLTAKGFENSIVTIVDHQADVVLSRTELSDPERAQVEDIVKRKCELEASQIVITLMELAE